MCKQYKQKKISISKLVEDQVEPERVICEIPEVQKVQIYFKMKVEDI